MVAGALIGGTVATSAGTLMQSMVGSSGIEVASGLEVQR